MKIAIGSDHGAFEYKQEIIKHLTELGHEVKDFGCYSNESCDYPDYILPVAIAVSKGEYDRGIAMCGTGIGASITANKVKGIRCALVNDLSVAKVTREHNDSNILSFGARVISLETAIQIVDVWLNTPFSNEERHIRRINKIKEYENAR